MRLDAPIHLEDLRTIEALAAEFPQVIPTVQTLRWQLRQRQENGLAAACVPQGKRTLISKARYEQWLEQRAGGQS